MQRRVRADILGVLVDAVNPATAADHILSWMGSGVSHYVCCTGVHGVMESQRDPALLAIHNGADLVVPDGMPLVWLSRLGGHAAVRRVYGPDLLLECCRRSVSPGYAHYFYGGAPGVAPRLVSALRNRFPGLRIAGTCSPPFGPVEPAADARMLQAINDSGADFVWVGLSTPKQERWMAAHVGRLRASAAIGVGAAFDFHAGLKPQAPQWVQNAGFEWLFRLLGEPRRLGPRYLRNNPQFVWRVLTRGWKRST